MDPWLLHFEAEADVKDPSGQVVRYVVDGKLQNIGAYNRFVTGTWSAKRKRRIQSSPQLKASQARSMTRVVQKTRLDAAVCVSAVPV